MMNDLNNFIDKMLINKDNPLDLSTDQDLAIGIMNLIAIEEHLFFTGAKTENNKYYDMISEIREIRKNALKKIIQEYEGEIWCTSKHLLSASMRFMEVGTKLLKDDKKEEAYNYFNQSYSLYCMFWHLNLKNISIDKVKSNAKEIIKNALEDENVKEKKDINFFSKMKEIVSKATDCCKE